MIGQHETVGTLIAWARQRLGDRAVAEPRREARLLLAHVLGEAPGAWVLRDCRIAVQSADAAVFRSLVERRAQREPLARITGSQGFWTLDLAVSDASLIPRADSECLIESLLALRCDRFRALRLLDLGTGTGCLLLAALSEYPQGWGLGIDLSEAACRLAASNARAAGLQARSAFLCASWSDPLLRLGGCLGPGFDVVLSNPPYIPAGDIAGLMPEVSRFEPRLALDGGADGLQAYRSIFARLGGLLAGQGIAIVEVGAGQIGEIPGLAAQAGLAMVSVHADLGGVPRAAVLRQRS